MLRQLNRLLENTLFTASRALTRRKILSTGSAILTAWCNMGGLDTAVAHFENHCDEYLHCFSTNKFFFEIVPVHRYLKLIFICSGVQSN